MNNSVKTQGSYIELSEHKSYLELSNLVCFYNSPSLNGLQLDYGETEEEQADALQKAQTLCLMPVYAKVTVNAKAEPTFAGHEAVRKANGEVIYKTVPIGVHESVVVEDHEVEIPTTGEVKTLPCLVAKQRIWSRNKNAVAAIKRLFSEGHLHNSFEMEVSQYVFDNGIRHAKDYEFVGNAFLASDSILHGASVKPAYGNSARVMEVAQETPDYELELANALAMDMAENKNEVNDEMLENEEAQVVEETNQVNETQPEQVENQEVVETSADETVEQPAQEESAEQTEETEEIQPVQEQSALTDYDIRRMVGKAYREAHKGCYAYVSFMFPEEHIAWMKVDEQLEAEFTQVSYRVENDTVTLTDEQVVKIALPVRELSAAYEKQVSEIEGLKTEISELAPYKEKVIAQEQAEAEEKHKKAVATLREMAEKAQCFTAEELSAMNDMFEQEKVMEVKAAIFDKKSAMMSNVETSEVETPKEEPKANLEHDQIDGAASVRRFLNV